MRKTIFGLVSFWLAGCGGDVGSVVQTGKSIYTNAVERLVLENHGGGFAMPLPSTAACDPQVAKYTLTVAGHELAWQYCAFHDNDETYEPKSGARMLSDSEWSSLSPALEALVVDDGKTCGADKPKRALIVTTNSRDVEYGDGFYGCQIHDKPLIKSESLDRAEQAFYELARK
jgi:hypothetical protein